MRLTDRLFKVGSLADSMGVYVPAMMLQKIIAMGRVVLFTYIMAKAQFGLWALAGMIFAVAAPLLTLGGSQGLMRYVSYYEARGQLKIFYRRIRWYLVFLVIALGLLAFAGSPLITKYVIMSDIKGAIFSYDQQQILCIVALINAMLLAAHQSLIGFMNGMRTYRMVSVSEIFFAVVFAVIALSVMVFDRSGLALCVSHGASVLLTIAFEAVLLHVAVERLGTVAIKPEEKVIATPDPEGEEVVVADVRNVTSEPGPETIGKCFWRILHFSLPAVFAATLAGLAQYISFGITSRRYGKEFGGEYGVFLQISQPVVFLANAAWAVVFSHIARHWESEDRRSAVLVLETAYKAVVMAVMTMVVCIYVSSPLWVKIFPAKYQSGIQLLGGLLLFFQTQTHLAIMTMMARLRETPIMIALVWAVALAVNIVLAGMWMGNDAAAGMISAATAAGLGMYIGGGIITVGYLLITRSRLHLSTYIVLACPIILLLPFWIAAAVWAAVLVISIFTPWLFSHRQKQLITVSAGRLRSMLLGRSS